MIRRKRGYLRKGEGKGSLQKRGTTKKSGLRREKETSIYRNWRSRRALGEEEGLGKGRSRSKIGKTFLS